MPEFRKTDLDQSWLDLKKEEEFKKRKKERKKQAGIDIVTTHRSNKRFEGHNYSSLIL